MRRRRTLAAAGITLALLTFVGVGVVFAVAGGKNSSGSSSGFGTSLVRMRAHNLKLQQIVLLLERQRQPVQVMTDPAITRKASVPSHGVPAAANASSAASTDPEESECDPNYEGACLDPNASDYDCEAGDGNGPDYTGEVRVVGEDHFGLDADGDGIGCDSE